MADMKRGLEILKTAKKMVSIHNIVTEVKNAFGWLISRLDIAEEGISMLKDLSVESWKT